MTSTEVSLDAPIDRQDREASTLGERFAGETHASTSKKAPTPG